MNGIENSDRWEVAGSEWGTEGDQFKPTVSLANIPREVGDGHAAVGSAAVTARAAARSHQGLYRCTADNGVGPPLVKHVNVTIHGTCPIKFYAQLHTCYKNTENF